MTMRRPLVEGTRRSVNMWDLRSGDDGRRGKKHFGEASGTYPAGRGIDMTPLLMPHSPFASSCQRTHRAPPARPSFTLDQIPLQVGAVSAPEAGKERRAGSLPPFLVAQMRSVICPSELRASLRVPAR